MAMLRSTERRAKAMLVIASTVATLVGFGFAFPEYVSRIVHRVKAVWRQPSYVERSLAADPGKRSSLRLLAVKLNGLTLDPKNATIEVHPGERITGTTTLRLDSEWRKAATVLAMTASWGDHAKSAIDLGLF